MSAAVPPLRDRPLATMKDMGMGDMGHGGMDMSGGMRGVDPTAEQNASAALATGAMAGGAAAMGNMDHGAMPMDHSGMAGMDHGAMAGQSSGMAGMDHSAMGGQSGAMAGMDHGSMSMRDFSNAPQVKKGPGVQTISPMRMDRTGEPGQGLENVGHKVLVYRDLMALDRNPDVRAPSRSIDIHLTGNMERFMWSFDGEKMSDVHEPIPFIEGERVRVNLINDSMMGHPIHIHGHFFELVTGHGDHAPRKHTVIVQPGGKVTWDFTADAVGDWAFHCHLLYHMHAGMMRVVSVRPRGDAACRRCFCLAPLPSFWLRPPRRRRWIIPACPAWRCRQNQGKRSRRQTPRNSRLRLRRHKMPPPPTRIARPSTRRWGIARTSPQPIRMRGTTCPAQTSRRLRWR
jgi:FtsP/CotA-like multicopper oxidase with cupredoxin domain